MSPTICILPWTHLYVEPSGKVLPCCAAFEKISVGDSKTHSLKDIFNNSNMKRIRRMMLDGEKPKECSTCYLKEKNYNQSPRIYNNNFFKDKTHLWNQTKNSGEINSKIIYWDIRFSNICNFTCRSCGPKLSSSWYEEYKTLTGSYPNHKKIMKAGRFDNDLLQQFEENIEYVEKIYFAGGEPLLMDEHKKILELLDKHQKYNVNIIYNTNLSQLKYKGFDFTNIWKKINKISISASLDAYGDRAEHLRKGTVWTEIEKNIQEIKKHDNIKFSVQYTLGIYNSFHLIDFINYFVYKRYVCFDDITINCVFFPHWLTIKILPKHIKEKLIKLYKNYIEDKKSFLNLCKEFEKLITLLEQNIDLNKVDSFLEYTEKYDKTRNENTFEIFPELKSIL